MLLAPPGIASNASLSLAALRFSQCLFRRRAKFGWSSSSFSLRHIPSFSKPSPLLMGVSFCIATRSLSHRALYADPTTLLPRLHSLYGPCAAFCSPWQQRADPVSREMETASLLCGFSSRYHLLLGFFLSFVLSVFLYTYIHFFSLHWLFPLIYMPCENDSLASNNYRPPLI